MKNLKIFWSCLAFTILLSGFVRAADEQPQAQNRWMTAQLKYAQIASSIINQEISHEELAFDANEKEVKQLGKLLTWYRDLSLVQARILENSQKEAFRLAFVAYAPILAWQVVTFDLVDMILFGAPAAYAAYNAIDKSNQDAFATIMAQKFNLPAFNDLEGMMDESCDDFKLVVRAAYASYCKCHNMEIPKGLSHNTPEEFEVWQNTPWYYKLMPMKTASKVYGWVAARKQQSVAKKQK